MADDLVFKVKFDLQKGVDEALKDGGGKAENINKPTESINTLR